MRSPIASRQEGQVLNLMLTHKNRQKRAIGEPSSLTYAANGGEERQSRITCAADSSKAVPHHQACNHPRHCACRTLSWLPG